MPADEENEGVVVGEDECEDEDEEGEGQDAGAELVQTPGGETHCNVNIARALREVGR